MKVSHQWQGMAELKADLATLTTNVQGSVIRTGVQSGSKFVVAYAKKTSPSKRLAKVLGYTAWYRGATAYSRIGAKKGTPHYRLLHLIENGTRAHAITMRPVRNGQQYTRTVQHPGTRPNPFLLPSLDRNRGEVQRKMLDAMRKRIDGIKLRLLKKRGV